MAEKISKNEVEHVARLARLHLTSEEIETYTNQLGEVLNYVDQLPEGTDQLKTQDSRLKTDGNQHLRKDEIISDDISRDKLLENVPELDGSSIKVPAVLGGGDE